MAEAAARVAARAAGMERAERAVWREATALGLGKGAAARRK
jgi:hypothetical protein